MFALKLSFEFRYQTAVPRSAEELILVPVES
jgi:hypothetical protein